MPVPVRTAHDYENRRGIINLAPANATGQPVTFEQLNALLEGMAFKDDVRVATPANVNLAAPGATIDGVTMAAGDRVLVRSQTAQPENGVYIWNGAATPMTRAADASTMDELRSAVVPVAEGTAGGTRFRQTTVGGTIGTANVLWTPDATGSPPATEGTAGIIEIATQAETNAGVSNNLAVPPSALAGWTGRVLRATGTIGDGTATLYTVTHNFNTRDVQVYCYENSGQFREIFVEKRHTGLNSVDLVFDVPPSANSVRVVILA